MEAVKLSQANQKLIQNRNIIQKEELKAPEQKKNGKKLLAFGALALSAIAVAGLIIKNKHNKLQEVANEAIDNFQKPAQEVIEEAQEVVDEAIEKTFKLSDVKFSKGKAYQIDSSEPFSGVISHVITQGNSKGDIVKMTYLDGKLQESSREGSLNFVKKYVYENKNSLKVVKESLDGAKETSYEYFKNTWKRAKSVTFSDGNKIEWLWDGRVKSGKLGNGEEYFYEEFNDGKNNTFTITGKFLDGSEKAWTYKKDMYDNSFLSSFRKKLSDGYQFVLAGIDSRYRTVEETFSDGNWIKWGEIEYPKYKHADRFVQIKELEKFIDEDERLKRIFREFDFENDYRRGKGLRFDKIQEKLTDGSERKWDIDELVYEKLPDGSVKEWYYDGVPKSGKFDDGSEFIYKDGIITGKFPDGKIEVWEERKSGNSSHKIYERLPDGTISRWQGYKLISKTLPCETEKRLNEKEALKRARRVQDIFAGVMYPDRHKFDGNAEKSAKAILDIKRQEIVNEAQRRIAQQKEIELAQAKENEYFKALKTPSKSACKSYYAIQKLKVQQAQDFYNKLFEDKLSHKSAKESAGWIKFWKELQENFDDGDGYMPPSRGGRDGDEAIAVLANRGNFVPLKEEKVENWYDNYLRLCDLFWEEPLVQAKTNEIPQHYFELVLKEENPSLYQRFKNYMHRIFTRNQTYEQDYIHSYSPSSHSHMVET